MQRYTAHGASVSVEDITCNYYDILKTAEEIEFDMPNYKKLECILQ